MGPANTSDFKRGKVVALQRSGATFAKIKQENQCESPHGPLIMGAELCLREKHLQH